METTNRTKGVPKPGQRICYSDNEFVWGLTPSLNTFLGYIPTFSPPIWRSCSDHEVNVKQCSCIPAELPGNLTIEQFPEDASDLAVSDVNLTCTTDCVSQKPDITWLIIENDKESLSPFKLTYSNILTDCEFKKKAYSFILVLPQNTTLPGNSDTTAYFQCAILTDLGINNRIYSPPSSPFRFAVQVTNVTLKNGEAIPSRRVAVVNNRSKTLTCVVSLSKPAATVVWYLGRTEVQRSVTTTTVNYTFTPTYDDDGNNISCKAFNTQKEGEAVESSVLTIDVGDLLMPPKNFIFTGFLADGAPSFVLQGGENGGFPQTFIIETSVKNSNQWTEKLRFKENDSSVANIDGLYVVSISGLGPESYLIRAVSENDAMRIADHLGLVTEVIVRKTCSCSDAKYVGGGLTGGIGLVVIIIVVVYIYKRIKGQKGDEDCSPEHYDTLDQKKDYVDQRYKTSEPEPSGNQKGQRSASDKEEYINISLS